MPVEVIDDIRGAEEKINQANPPPYAFVNACYRPHEGSLRSKFEGLKKAYEMLKENPDSKIVVYGVLSQTAMYGILGFQRLMVEFPENVRYFGLIPRGFDDFNERDPFKKSNHVSPALKLVVGRRIKTNKTSRLKHDLNYPYLRKGVIEFARKEFGFSGTDDEVASQIKEYDFKSKIEEKPMFNERLAGVYCDVEGTLILNRLLNEPLREELESMSYDKPVTLWTGSDPAEKAVELNSYWLEWPVLSKEWFGGCKAEFVIDDMPQDEFEREYGIKAETFRQI